MSNNDITLATIYNFMVDKFEQSIKSSSKLTENSNRLIRDLNKLTKGLTLSMPELQDWQVTMKKLMINFQKELHYVQMLSLG